MRSTLFGLALLLGFLAPSHAPPPQEPATGRIEGRVIRHAGGEPIADVEVQLLSTSKDVYIKLSLRTDASGRFEAKGLPKSAYRIAVQREGYFPRFPKSGTISLTLPDNSSAANVTLTMTKLAAISGRVRTENSAPIVGTLTVIVYHVVYAQGSPELISGSTTTVDADGAYRLVKLQPGTYYVAVEPTASAAVKGQTAPSATWRRTFLPGVADPALAQPINLADGEDVQLADLPIQAAGETYRISGKVIDPLPWAPRPPYRAEINLVPKAVGVVDSPTTRIGGIKATVIVRDDERFEVLGVPPGLYSAFLSIQDFSDRVRYNVARQDVTLVDRDVDNVDLTVRPGADIVGLIVIRGGATPSPQKLKVQVRAADEIPTPLAEAIIIPGDTGRFRAKDRPESRVDLEVTGLPPDAYVAEIRQGGVALPGGTFMVTLPQTDLEIIVEAVGGRIDGALTEAVPERSGVTIVAVPNLPNREKRSAYRSSVTDANGRFLLRGLAPGEYKLFAFDNPPNTAPWLNARFLSHYEERGTAITVGAGGTTNTARLDSVIAGPY